MSLAESQKFLRFATLLRNLTDAWYVQKSSSCRNFDGLYITLRVNIPLVGNNLFAGCYRGVGRKELLKTINL